MAVCYRHPARETGVSCSNCGRPICTDCMTTTSVGMRCPECAREKTQVKTIGSLVTEPTATYVLIAINVLVYFGSASGGSIAARGALDERTLLDGEYWQLLTSGFLHFGLIHLLFNMYALYYLGQILEGALGHGRFLALYFVSLLGGSLGVVLLSSPPSVTRGASGAVFGLMGAAVMVARSRGISLADSGLGVLIALNLGITFLIPNISIGGHIGGLVTGLICGLALTEGQRRRQDLLAYAVCALLAVAVVVGALVAAGRDTV